MKNASARHFVLLLMVVAGVLIGAEVVCGCFPGKPPLLAAADTPEGRAERAALAHIGDRGGKWTIGRVDARRTPEGWVVHVDWEPATPGAHCSVYLDSEFEVVRVMPGA